MQKKEIGLEIFKRKYLIDNLTIPQCAEYFKCGKTTIIRFCAKHNIKKDKELVLKNIKANRKRIPKAIKDSIIKVYFEDNLSRKEVARSLNINIGTVNKVISKSGRVKSKVSLRSSRIKVKIGKEELERLYLCKNLSLQELSAKLKIGATTLSAYLKHYNISKPEALRKIKVIESFVKTGKGRSIEGMIVTKLSEKFNISVTAINKFIRENPDLSDKEIVDSIKDISLSTANFLEKSFAMHLNLDFYNKKAVGGYQPDFKLNEDLYINVDGLYWHSERIKKDRLYHFNMRKSYEAEGKRILQFREDEVSCKIDIIKSMVNNAINKDVHTIYARKTEVRPVNQGQASKFCNDNHLMGGINAKHLGLFYENEVIFLVSYKVFGNTLKIERLCSKLGKRVVGGYGKVEKRLIELCRPEEVHYWVDLRYGTGNFLLNMGYSLKKETLGWKWTDLDRTYNRRKVRANMDSRKLKERDYARELGLVRIYDAGQRLFTKTV